MREDTTGGGGDRSVRRRIASAIVIPVAAALMLSVGAGNAAAGLDCKAHPACKIKPKPLGPKMSVPTVDVSGIGAGWGPF
jgi:hypothetical protein